MNKKIIILLIIISLISACTIEINITRPETTQEQTTQTETQTEQTTQEQTQKQEETQTEQTTTTNILQDENCETKIINHIYHVCTCEDLQNTEYENGRSITLQQDIDCTDTKNWNSGAGFKPLGTTTKQYKGTINGQGYTIHNLYINRPNEKHIGLIGFAEKGTDIRNIKFENAKITGEQSVGIVIGQTLSATITNIEVTNSEITATTNNAGGIIGAGLAGGTTNLISVSNTKVNAKIEAENSNTGGIIGTGSGHVTIFKIEFDGEIKGKTNTGGIIGYQNSANTGKTLISETKIKGTIQGTNKIGGATGYSIKTEHNRIQSYAKITGIDQVGGIIGDSKDDIIKDSYFKGEIEGIERIGGLIGDSKHHRELSNSYTEATIKGNAIVGGLIGSMTFGTNRPGTDKLYVASTIIANEEYDAIFPRRTNPGGNTNIYVDKEISGTTWLAESGYAEEKTTQEMKSREPYTTWRISGKWKPLTGEDYPRLTYE